MEIWILIIILAKDISADMFSQEFEGRAACENAKQIIRKNNNLKSNRIFDKHVTMECVPKRIEGQWNPKKK
jgi:hypothetical protein